MSSSSPPPLTLPISQSSQPSAPVIVEEIVTTIRVPVLRPKPAFLRILQLGGGTGETFTMSDIIELMKNYIEDRKLYDERDPRFIHCQNDLLGEVFNVNSFTLGEALKLFSENCNLTPDTCLRIKRQIVTRSDPGTAPTAADSHPSNQQSLSPPSGATSAVMSSTPEAAGTTGRNETPSAELSQQIDNPLTATPPVTCVTQKDLEDHVQHGSRDSEDNANDPAPLNGDQRPGPSQNAQDDEPDGSDSPWSCQVVVERPNPSLHQRTRSHDSLVVECTSDTFSVEYEVMSSSDAELVPGDGNDESEASSSSCDTTEVIVVCQESDIEYLADYSDSESDSDAELSHEDKWQCSQCQFKNSAFYRNCERCWNIRPDWLPTHSENGTCKVDKEEQSRHEGVEGACPQVPDDVKEDISPVDPEKPQPLKSADFPPSHDSAFSSFFSSQEPSIEMPPSPSANAKLSSKELESQDANGKDCVMSFPEKRKPDSASDLSDSNEDESGTKKQKRQLQPEMNPSDRCVICWTRAKTASIIHGKTGHQVCCYRCAKRLKQQRKSCPICRKPIQKVIRNFF